MKGENGGEGGGYAMSGCVDLEESHFQLFGREREREREGERGFGGEGVLRFNFQSIDTAYGFCLKYSKFQVVDIAVLFGSQEICSPTGNWDFSAPTHHKRYQITNHTIPPLSLSQKESWGEMLCKKETTSSYNSRITLDTPICLI